MFLKIWKIEFFIKLDNCWVCQKSVFRESMPIPDKFRPQIHNSDAGWPPRTNYSSLCISRLCDISWEPSVSKKNLAFNSFKAIKAI